MRPFTTVSGSARRRGGGASAACAIDLTSGDATTPRAAGGRARRAGRADDAGSEPERITPRRSHGELESLVEELRGRLERAEQKAKRLTRLLECERKLRRKAEAALIPAEGRGGGGQAPDDD